jgi:hypothetical protein
VEAPRVETSRLPHFLDIWLTDGGEVVSLTHWAPFTPRKTRGINFYNRLSQNQLHSEAGRIRSIEKSNNLSGKMNLMMDDLDRLKPVVGLK